MTDLSNFLATRRSARAGEMNPAAAGPSPEQLQRILTIGVRVPDHGKLTPWRLVTFAGQARERFGTQLAEIFVKNHPDTKPAGVLAEQQRFLRAPLVVAVISTPKPHKIPVWEQQLSAGTVCYNLCLAAMAEGFGAVWLTEWPAFDPGVAALLDMQPGDQIAGFIYIGVAAKQEDRPRPALAEVVRAYPDN